MKESGHGVLGRSRDIPSILSRGDHAVGLQLDAASGDRDPNDGTSGTFNPLFPNGYYINLSGFTGYTNFIHLKPSLTLQPVPDLTLLLAAGLLWRESIQDAVYAQPEVPIAGTAGHGGQRTALYGQLRAEWTVTRSLALAFEANYYEVASSIRDVGGRNSNTISPRSFVGPAERFRVVYLRKPDSRCRGAGASCEFRSLRAAPNARRATPAIRSRQHEYSRCGQSLHPADSRCELCRSHDLRRQRSRHQVPADRAAASAAGRAQCAHYPDRRLRVRRVVRVRRSDRDPERRAPGERRPQAQSRSTRPRCARRRARRCSPGAITTP